MIRFYPALVAVLLLTASNALAQTTTDKPALGSTFSVPVLADLPTGGSLYSIFDTIPGEVTTEHLDTGGMYTGEMARIGSHGSSWTQTLFRVGDVNVTNPFGGGTPLLVPLPYAWDRVDINTGLMPIETNAPGMAVTLVPRSPSRTWIRMFEFLGSGPAFMAGGEVTDPPAIARQHAWNNGTFLVSGPIVPNRLGLVLTGTLTKSTRLERDDPTLLDSSLGSVFTHLVFTPNTRDALHIVGWVEGSTTPDAYRTQFGQPLADDKSSAGDVQATWERSDSKLNWALYGNFGRRAQSNTLPTDGTFVVDRVYDGPIPDLLNPATGSEMTWSVGGRATLAPRTLSGRKHVVRAGLELSGANASLRSTFNGQIGELVAGIPARVWEFTSPDPGSDWSSTDFAIYAADTWILHPRFTLDGGVRFESVHGSAQGSASNVSWNNWLPRASMRWEFSNWAHIAAVSGFSRYGHRLLLNELAEGDPSAPFGNVFRWNGANPQQPTPGVLIGPVGPGTGGNAGLASIDPALNRPYQDEFIAGFESRPRADTVIRLAALARRDRQVLGVMDVGVPASAYTKTVIHDPGDDHSQNQPLPVYNRPISTFGDDQYLLTNPPDNEATFVGVELTFQTTFPHLYIMFGATAGRSEAIAGNVGFGPLENDHGVLGDVYIDPNSGTYAKGRVFTERGYTMKSGGVVTLPWDVKVGYAARYQDGQHFARLVIVPGLNQGAEQIRAFRNGTTRFTMTPTLDLRLQKSFTLNSTRLSILMDVYNVLNMSYEVEEFPVTGPTSRLTSAVQPPLAMRLGFRYTF